MNLLFLPGHIALTEHKVMFHKLFIVIQLTVEIQFKKRNKIVLFIVLWDHAGISFSVTAIFIYLPVCLPDRNDLNRWFRTKSAFGFYTLFNFGCLPQLVLFYQEYFEIWASFETLKFLKCWCKADNKPRVNKVTEQWQHGSNVGAF